MLKKLRVCLAAVFWLGITILFLDFTGALHGWLGWMAKIQFLPAVMALNAGVIISLMLLTLVFGRAYCSVICPLGVFQDGVAHISKAYKKRHGKRRPYSSSPEKKWLRYSAWALFVLAFVLGLNAFVSILAPYSAYGRIVQNLFQPLYIWCNNLLALAAERVNSYAFYSGDVWLRSLPAFAVAAATLVTIVILAWKHGRTWCNTVCPVGTTLSFFSRFAMFRPVIDTDKCKDCKLCEHNCKAACIDIDSHSIDYSRCVDCFNCIDKCRFGALRYRFAWKRKDTANMQTKAGCNTGASSPATAVSQERRAFLTGTAIAAGTIGMKAQVTKTDGGLAIILDKKAPQRKTCITPPGSISARNMYSHCTACQLCVAECPNHVLRPSSDLDRFMQPESSFERGWCRPECTLCSEVCPTGAIRKTDIAEKSSIQTGHAVWVRDNCIPLKDGVECGNCARHCPSGAIIMVNSVLGDPSSVKIPAVNESRCIGCGACEHLCPSRPFSAIYVEGHSEHRHI